LVILYGIGEAVGGMTMVKFQKVAVTDGYQT
jgi:hypothetical protein